MKNFSFIDYIIICILVNFKYFYSFENLVF